MPGNYGTRPEIVKQSRRAASELRRMVLQAGCYLPPNIAPSGHHKIIKVQDMSRPKNVLWIMCDQLRHDYLGCTGHPTLKTPNIDAMARRGVRFSNAYVQSPICGPSRMSFYTGRYMRSHG